VNLSGFAESVAFPPTPAYDTRYQALKLYQDKSHEYIKNVTDLCLLV
jgi:hypothetical protein